MYLYHGNKADEGNVRESFLVNQLSYNQTVEISKMSDFFVNNKYTIECGGKNKTGEQIKSLENAFIAADGIETGTGSKKTIMAIRLSVLIKYFYRIYSTAIIRYFFL
jgi:hypothetical protein